MCAAEAGSTGGLQDPGPRRPPLALEGSPYDQLSSAEPLPTQDLRSSTLTATPSPPRRRLTANPEEPPKTPREARRLPGDTHRGDTVGVLGQALPPALGSENKRADVAEAAQGQDSRQHRRAQQSVERAHTWAPGRARGRGSQSRHRTRPRRPRPQQHSPTFSFSYFRQ